MRLNPQYARYRRVMIGILAGLILILSGFVIYIVREITGIIDDFEITENAVGTAVYSSDNKLLGTYFSEENRINIQLEDVPRSLLDALVVTEDVRFYHHSGVDMFGVLNMAGSVISKLWGGDIRGGSTITQQLARNLYNSAVGRDRTMMRKIKEMVAAVYLERIFTKGEIIVHYLNTVPFGGQLYGVQAASKYYFRKDCRDLDVKEAALLVGMLKGPTVYHPILNPENSVRRRNVVLSLVRKHGVRDQSEADSILRHFQQIQFADDPEERENQYAIETGTAKSHSRQLQNEGLATYFREYLRQWLKDWCRKCDKQVTKPDGTKDCPDIYRDGLRVYTTIHSIHQKHAEDAVREHLSKHQQRFFRYLSYRRKPWQLDPSILERAMTRSARYQTLKRAGWSREEIERNFHEEKRKMRVFRWEGDQVSSLDTTMTPWDSLVYYAPYLETGMVSINQNNGHILAWVGGIDQEFFQYDHVAQGKRQVGSTFKPFVYTTAIDNGWSPCEFISNEPYTVELPEGSDPPVWTPKNASGEFSEGMTMKRGLAMSVNLVAARVCNELVSPQEVMKFAQNMGIKSELEPVPSIALGPFDLTVRELTSAYTTISGLGRHHEPVFITRIEDRDGNILYTEQRKSTEPLRKETAYVMVDMLRAVVTSGTAADLHWKHKVPSEVFVSGKTGTTNDHSDGWFVGFTPHYTAGVWVGCAERGVSFRYSPLGYGGNMALPIFAIYTRKMYEDPRMNLDRSKRFKAPPIINIETNCERFKANRPEEPESFESIYDL